MKVLFIVLLLSVNALGSSIGQFRDSPEGSSLQRFTFKNEKTEREKRSNFFDKTKNYEIGTYSAKKNKELKKIEDKLNVLLSQIKLADDFLKQKGSSFNDLTKRSHQTVILLNDYRIAANSELYKEALVILDKLKALDWHQEDVIQLSMDTKEITLINDGKVKGKEPFDVPFYCKKQTPPTVCGYKKFGIIYIE